MTMSYRPEALSELLATLLAAFEGGVERVVLDLDPLAHLDAEGVRGLITLLRRSREVGGAIALHTSRSDISRSLSLMALDRLFPMVSAA